MHVKFRFLFFSLLGLTIYFCFSQNNAAFLAKDRYAIADHFYSEAAKLSAAADFDDAAVARQENLNKKALVIFKQLISATPAGINDSLLFQCNLKAGLLLHYFDSLPQARLYYLQAISFRDKLPALPDSFFFKPYLFTGSIFYSSNQFDSALIFYKKAEEVASHYNHPLQEAERLYNQMGVMYYEAGNYRLANDYFKKAISLLSPANSSYQNLLINYKMNIASIMIKLEEYGKADTVFKTILPFQEHLNEINHNLGIIQLRTENYAQALTDFKKVNYNNSPKNIELYYNMAEAFSGLQQKDSSAFYITKAIAENKRINGDKKNSSLGLALKFMGDEKEKNNETVAAINYYQQALYQFYPGFKNADYYAVPLKYSGVFSYINLFHTLVAKADALSNLYKTSGNQKNLEASLNAYRSAFELADYVAKTYDSDEARLFLNRIKYAEHDKAINISIALFELTGNKNYLEEAYLFDQRNKASSLTLALQQNSIKKKAGILEVVFLQQSSLQSAITRLSIKANRITDSALLAGINNEIRDKEIKLAGIQEQINSNPLYASLQSSIQIPSIEKLQQILDDKTTLLSYHPAENEMLIFCISKHRFYYVRQPVDSNFAKNIRALINSLHNMNQAERYAGLKPASQLYQSLIKPVLSGMENTTRLIIIPADELNYIPFEVLQDEHQKYLLQSYAVQYQFSTALLQPGEIKAVLNHDNLSLGFAPFTKKISGSNFTSLPYSKEEVAKLNGKVFYDKEATKQHFIEYANKYPIVQLATHAAANDALPLKSFIAFYPQQKDSVDEYTLYAQEIYNLRLDSIHLIILSACETGSGQLIKGEGLMSITRAFAYAGCPNIITSLWKAADKTTAFITQHLHFYLDKGFTKDRALQLAKSDLLNSNEIPPSLKTPNYWAQLIFIGNYQPETKPFCWWWLITGLVIMLIGLLIYKKKSRNKAGR